MKSGPSFCKLGVVLSKIFFIKLINADRGGSDHVWPVSATKLVRIESLVADRVHASPVVD